MSGDPAPTRSSTAAPEASTAAPEASTAAPEESTAAPEASTAAPKASTAAPKASTHIQVLDRAVELMAAIAERPRLLNAQELARLCDLNRTTAWRILLALEQNGLVRRDPASQRYALGVTLARLGAAADSGRLIRVAHGLLQELADEFHEQVSLGVPTVLGFSYVEHVQPDGASPIPRWLGQSGPLHATASGKVFLSRLSLAERNGVLPPELERFTTTTIVAREALDSELDAARRDGFAIGAGEHDELTSAVCAPVLDPGSGALLAAIDLWGPSQRLGRRQLGRIGRRLHAVADRLALLLIE